MNEQNNPEHGNDAGDHKKKTGRPDDLSRKRDNRKTADQNQPIKDEQRTVEGEEQTVKQESGEENQQQNKGEKELRDESGHRYLSPEAINAWRISGALGSLVYWIIPLVYGAVSMGASGWPEWPSYVLGVLFLTYTLLEATVIPWIRWIRWRYHVDHNEIDLRRGLFIVIRTLIPVKRVQHVDTRQGPVYRQFGLASVTITTAGDTHEIPALSEPVADELRNKISEYARVAREDL